MLVVKIEMWPHGREDRAFEIGRTYVANDGSGSPDRGDYKVAVCRRGGTAVPREIYPKDLDKLDLPKEALDKFKAAPKAARAGRIENYPRLAYNVWRLIARALLSSFPEEQRLKPGVMCQLGEQVMRGLQLLKEHLQNDGHNWTGGTDMEDVEAALAWLAAANRDAAEHS